MTSYIQRSASLSATAPVDLSTGNGSGQLNLLPLLHDVTITTVDGEKPSAWIRLNGGTSIAPPSSISAAMSSVLADKLTALSVMPLSSISQRLHPRSRLSDDVANSPLPSPTLMDRLPLLPSWHNSCLQSVMAVSYQPRDRWSPLLSALLTTLTTLRSLLLLSQTPSTAYPTEKHRAPIICELKC